MNFKDIHGTDRRYYLDIAGVRDEEKVFEIAGYGVTQRDIEKEETFRRLITAAPTISFQFQDERF